MEPYSNRKSHKPEEKLREEPDESDLKVRVGVSVDPVVGLHHQEPFPVSLQKTLVFAGGNVQDEPGRVEATGSPLKREENHLCDSSTKFQQEKS